MEVITGEEKIISGENLTPITRKEMFLAKAAGQDVETPKPITREEIFLSKISGGGGGATTWKDLGEPVVEIFPETELELIDGSAIDMPGTWFANVTIGEFEIGQNYTVIFNGTTYNLTALDDGGGQAFLGNPGIIGVGDDNGVPFLTAPAGFITIVDTAKLYIQGRKLTPIDPKYLPEIPVLDLSQERMTTGGGISSVGIETFQMLEGVKMGGSIFCIFSFQHESGQILSRGSLSRCGLSEFCGLASSGAGVTALVYFMFSLDVGDERCNISIRYEYI